MSQSNSCLCKTISPILQYGRWTGVLPVIPGIKKSNDVLTGCSFQISKRWYIVSVILQLLLFTYISMTTIFRFCYGPDKSQNGFEWYVMTVGYLIIGSDCVVSLVLGASYSGRICKILEKLSSLPSTNLEMPEISRKLRIICFLVFSLFFVMLGSFLYMAWLREKCCEEPLTVKNILDSGTGVVIRGLIGLFAQVQCIIVFMFCVLLIHKFQSLSEFIKVTLQRALHHSTSGKVDNVKFSVIKLMELNTSCELRTADLEHINEKYQNATDCLTEVNHCIGFQLLVTLSANLFSLVYYMYRYIRSSNQSLLLSTQQRTHCILSIICVIIRLLLYMYMGQRVKTESTKPVLALKSSKILQLPFHLQQQVQSLILQWTSSKPGYLSAFNVMNVGPWLLAPIVGNVITYLLVVMQFDGSTSEAPDHINDNTESEII